ncbi:MAG TPA: hypothetical protein VIY08_14370 [Candidatus Nitrosocosmicus sp.]
MKTPICTFDAKTGILCNMCENKLDSGQITNSDVEGSIVLTKLALNNSDIDKLTLMGSREIEDDVILFFKSSDVRAIRSNVKLIDLIHQAFNKNIWIVESDSNDRRFLENLFYPIRIDNINFVWLPDGQKLTRVVMSKKINNMQEKTLEKIKRLSLSLRSIELIVESELQ